MTRWFNTQPIHRKLVFTSMAKTTVVLFAADDLTAVYPYPGQVNVPLNFDGRHEGPTPPEPPTGWPSASPIHLYVKDYTVTSHDVFVKDVVTKELEQGS